MGNKNFKPGPGYNFNNNTNFLTKSKKSKFIDFDLYNDWVIYLRRVIHQLLVRVVLRVESKEFHAVGHQLSKYMKNNTIVNQG